MWLILTALGREHMEQSRLGAPTERYITLTRDENYRPKMTVSEGGASGGHIFKGSLYVSGLT